MLLTDEDFKRRKPEPPKPQPQKAPVQKAAPDRPKQVSVVYIRVPSKNSEIYKKCENIVEIFEGFTRVSFYFADTKKYADHMHGMVLGDVQIAELRRLAGEDSVVLK
jgi:hypothetical protein